MDPILGLAFWLLLGAGAKTAFDHARDDFRKSRDARVEQAEAEIAPKALPTSHRRQVVRRHAVGWWASETLHGFPVHRTGWHAGWLAHKAAADHQKAIREEARTKHLDTRASILKALPEHRKRQAQAQVLIDEALAKRQEETGQPVRGRKAVKEAASGVVLPFRQRDEKTGAPPLPADGVTLLTVRSKSGERINPLSGAPEDTIAVYGKDDLDGRLAAAAANPDIEVTTRPAPDAFASASGEQAKGSQEAANRTASSATEGAPSVTAETTFRQVQRYHAGMTAACEQVGAQLAADVGVASQVAEDLQAADADAATIGAHHELAGRLGRAQQALQSVAEQVEVCSAALSRHTTLAEAHENSAVEAADKSFYEA